VPFPPFVTKKAGDGKEMGKTLREQGLVKERPNGSQAGKKNEKLLRKSVKRRR
jgi:hypothetical protein